MSLLTTIASAFKGGGGNPMPLARNTISPWAAAMEGGAPAFDYASAVQVKSLILRQIRKLAIAGLLVIRRQVVGRGAKASWHAVLMAVGCSLHRRTVCACSMYRRGSRFCLQVRRGSALLLRQIPLAELQLMPKRAPASVCSSKHLGMRVFSPNPDGNREAV